MLSLVNRFTSGGCAAPANYTASGIQGPADKSTARNGWAGRPATMERITARADNDFSLVLYGSLWVMALVFIWITCRADPEAPVVYNVEPPAQAAPGWKGQVLEKPALKVCHLSASIE